MIRRHRGHRVEIDPRDFFIGSELIVDGTWEESLMSAIENLSIAGRTAVDVGAHVGLYTLLLSRMVGDEGAVVAIEPDATHFGMLERNLRRNRILNVRALRAAAGAREGHAWLERHEPNLGAHRVVSNPTAHPVEVVTVDSVANPPDIVFVKIDAEGSERDVLRGMTHTIEESVGLTIQLELELSTGPGPESTLQDLMNSGFEAVVQTSGFVPLSNPKQLRSFSAGDRVNLLLSRNESFLRQLQSLR